MADQRDGGIAWTDQTWNPIRGCSRVSPGCGGPNGGGCYAEAIAARFSDPGQPYNGLAKRTADGPRWTGQVRLIPEVLDQPLRWRRPRRVFVNSMSDLFHEALSNEDIAAVFGVMGAAPQHSFQVLTKRAMRMRNWFNWSESFSDPWTECHALALERDGPCEIIHKRSREAPLRPWSLPNVWLGVSVEDQQRADERIPLLLQTPSAVRFLSCEPLLGPIDLSRWLACQCGLGPDPFKAPEQHARGCPERDRLHWVVIGGESGPGARPMDFAWARSIIAQCRAIGVAVFMKQAGALVVDSDRLVGIFAPHDARSIKASAVLSRDDNPPHLVLMGDRKGGDPAEWPADLRVREWPEVRP